MDGYFLKGSKTPQRVRGQNFLGSTNPLAGVFKTPQEACQQAFTQLAAGAVADPTGEGTHDFWDIEKATCTEIDYSSNPKHMSSLSPCDTKYETVGTCQLTCPSNGSLDCTVEFVSNQDS